MNEIKKTTLHPDSQPNVDLYPKTSADQIESLDARIKALSTQIYKVSIDLPKGAKNGNITQSQLNILQVSEFNCIEMKNDNEIYYLNDPGHEEGFLTYSHVGIENSKTTIKTLTITVSAKSFVIVTTVVPTDDGSGNVCLHKLTITVKSGTETQGVIVGKLLSSIKTKLTEITPTQYKNLFDVCGYKSSLSGLCYLTNQQMMDFATFGSGIYNFIGYEAGANTYPFQQSYSGVFSGTSYTVSDTVIEL